MGSTYTDTPQSIIKTYRQCFDVAMPSYGLIKRKDEKNYHINCVFDSLDYETLETKKTVQRYKLFTSKPTNHKGSRIKHIRLVSDHLPVDLTKFRTDNRRLFVKLKSPSTTNASPTLEIWNSAQQHLKSLDISDLAQDYKNADNTTGTFRWCPYEKQDKLLYICRSQQIDLHPPKRPKLEEPLTGAVKSRTFQDEHTVVRIIDVSSDCQTTTIDMEGFSLSDSRWMDRGDKVVSVACPDESNQLSLIEGIKRSSKIVIHDVTQSPPVLVQELTDESNCFYSPRVDHSGQRFVCLTTDKNICRASDLCLYDIRTRKQRILLDESTNRNSFIHSLPNNCFTENDKLILFQDTSNMRARTRTFNLDQSTCNFLNTDMRILDFNHNIILFANSNADKLPTLAVCIFDQSIPIKEKLYCPKMYELETASASKGIRTARIRYWDLGSPMIDGALFTCPDNINVLLRQGEPLKVYSSNYQDLPMVVLIHKEPHTFVNRHMPWLTFYNNLGLITILINHRDSRGVIVADSSQSGSITGGIDMAACLTVVRDHIERGEVDSGLIVGGSHGNCCHLSGTNKLNLVVRPPVDSMKLVREIDATTDCRSDEKHFDLKRRLKEMFRSRARWPISSNHLADLPTLILFGYNAQLYNLFHKYSWTELLNSSGFELKEGTPDPNKEAAIWLLQHLPLSGGELLV